MTVRRGEVVEKGARAGELRFNAFRGVVRTGSDAGPAPVGRRGAFQSHLRGRGVPDACVLHVWSGDLVYQITFCCTLFGCSQAETGVRVAADGRPGTGDSPDTRVLGDGICSRGRGVWLVALVGVFPVIHVRKKIYAGSTAVRP